MSDEDLIRLLKRDDDAAYAEIYARYAASLIGFAAAKLYSLEAARDMIQDVFVHLWETRETLHIHTSLKAYLFAVTRYRVIDHIRKNVTRESYAQMLQSSAIAPVPTAEQQLEGRELQEQISRSLQQLSPRVREVYLLSREENLSIPEIAERLNVSEQTVKNQLSTALGHLRKSFTRLLSIFLF